MFDACFIVDFYCHQAGLVIEVDGPIHAQQKAEDAARTDAISKHGLKVVRFTNQEVMNNINPVLQRISKELESNTPFLEERG
jgi:very-short-patch-repair endonuclease